MEIVYALVLLTVVAPFVVRPLLRQRAAAGGAEARLEEFEARKQAKYRELRDTELDHAAGKLTDEDYRDRRATLRSEAAAILGQMSRGNPETER
jgi:hypothetical protein